MGIRRILAPLALALLVAPAAAVGQEERRPFPAAIADLAALERAEIRDASGQVVLGGNFVTVSEPDGDVERAAGLSPVNGGAGVGEVEIEISSSRGAAAREMEVSVEGLAPTAQYRLFVDGTEIASFTTDAAGEAEIEFGDDAAR